MDYNVRKEETELRKLLEKNYSKSLTKEILRLYNH